MPSFANLSLTNGDIGVTDSGRVDDMMDCPAVDDILQSQRNEARIRARHIIQVEIPAYITRIVAFVREAETDSKSIFHADRIAEGGFVTSGVELIAPHAHRKAMPDESKSSQTQNIHQGEEPTSPMAPSAQKVVFGSDSSLSDHPIIASMAHNNGPGKAKFEAVTTWVKNGHAGGAAKLDFGRSLEDEEEGSGTRWLGGLKSNDVCVKILNVLDDESETLMTYMKDIIHFVHMQTPTMEDGNNFGVEVQETVVSVLDKTLGTALKLHGLARSHFNDRMTLASSWNRYPNLEDHAAAIAASDRFDRFLAVNALRTLRNNATSSLLTMKTNWPKVSDPKGLEGGHSGGHHTMGMY